jgi:hypothetical protein
VLVVGGRGSQLPAFSRVLQVVFDFSHPCPLPAQRKLFVGVTLFATHKQVRAVAVAAAIQR